MKDESAIETQPEPPRSNLANWIGVIAIVVGGLLFIKVLRDRADETRSERNPAVGKPLMALDLTPLVNADKPLDLRDVEGQVVLINFWGTWCPPCRQEFPHMVDLYNEYRDNDDFRLVSVSCEAGGGPVNFEEFRRQTAAYLDRNETDLPVFADVQGDTRMKYMMLSEQTGMGIPLNILLDRQGVIRGVWEGYRSGDEKSIAAEIETLLQEKE